MERFRPSVTVAAVIAQAGRYLLVEEETPEGLMLNNPAGHLKQGESPVEAVVREALEETARHFVPEAFLGVYLARFVRPARPAGPQAASTPPSPERDCPLGSGPAGVGEDVTYVRLAFSGAVGEAIAGRALDQGIRRTLWMSEAELAACADRHRSPLVLQCVRDHAAGRRLPLDTVSAHPSLARPLVKT
ncbi:NUDIX domain-containing protein [Roseateles sp.]|uniref:NUDIX domain-containing protein n=1 Tax=Roseateles sp. TaxID=1971397 RepID=UPI0025FCB4C3|nr:NUDIX hydrolase [Roseateles sp.]MBV8034550.1 NUDIX hydrolase [Roseateles sp.]